MERAAPILQSEYSVSVQPISAVNIRGQYSQLRREYFPTFAESSKMMIILEITVIGRVNQGR